jgi:hypothetical protein
MSRREVEGADQPGMAEREGVVSALTAEGTHMSNILADASMA